MAMELTSPAFANGGRMPDRYTCTGEDMSPPLIWSDPPKGTRSFALFCDDPDAPGGIFHHWAVYDIPVDIKALPEGFSASGTAGPLQQGVNDFGATRYGGACPPKGHGTHHYHFKLMALDVDHLDIRGRRCGEIEAAARRHAVAETTLIGTYSR